MYKNQHITAVIPARDEANSIAEVISDIQALQGGNTQPVFDRIIVCDNGSIDSTTRIAQEHGADVIYQAAAGYGIACLTALSLINKTDMVVFIDADASLRIGESIQLIEAIHQGADLAIGARHKHLQEADSMTLPQRFGNLIASALIRLIWRVPVSDLGPFRAIRYQSLQVLDMQDRRFGWTVEMQVKAIQLGMNLVEIPVHYRRRTGKSKISGTISGVIGAGVGIFATIFKLALKPAQIPLHPRQRQS